MKKLIELSKIIKKLGLQEESYFIYRMAMALPTGTSVEQESIGPSSGVPGGITPEFLRKNISLKEIFKNHYDPNFFKSFNYIHYFRSSDSSAEEYVKSYGPSSGGNPVEISVAGAPIPICELKDKTQSALMGKGSFAFRLEGEPTSAFYYDATSSYFQQMHSPHWLSTLEEFGINPEEYNPKLINISEGRLDSFFFDQNSYEEAASMGHQSTYHEIFLKNSKVKEILLDESLDKEEVREFLDRVDPYWLGNSNQKIIDVSFCSGSSKITGLEARHKIIEWVESYFTEGEHGTILDSQKFNNMFGYAGAESASESGLSYSEKMRKGLQVLEDGLYNKSRLKEIFSSLNLILPSKDGRQEYVNNFMSIYLDQYRNTDSIYNLEELWEKVFSSNSVYKGVDSIYRPSTFEGYSGTSGKKEVYNILPIEEITKPIFNKIKQNILNKISSPASVGEGITIYYSILSFLADIGMYCYESNIKNKSFDYYLTMVRETEDLTRIIMDNDIAKNSLVENYDASIITQIYDLSRYSPDTLRMIVDAYNTYPEYKEEVDDAIAKAERYAANNRKSLV